MKSNEEFIAGIYEKAAVYTEEKQTKRSRHSRLAKAAGIAAMAAVCLGLAGAGVLTLNKNGGQNPNGIAEQAGENYGIALTSGPGEVSDGATQFRISPMMETATFTGVVERIDAAENRIWLKLVFDESAPDYAEGSVVCIRWDMLENIEEEIAVGVMLTATGALSQYVNEASSYNGCAELILTDTANLIIRCDYGIQ